MRVGPSLMIMADTSLEGNKDYAMPETVSKSEYGQASIHESLTES